MAKAKKTQLIECKGNTLAVIVVTLRSLEPAEIASVADELFGDDAFFDGDAALLELGQLGEASSADWDALRNTFAGHGLHIIGVRGSNEALCQNAALAGLPNFPAAERPVRQQPEPPAEAVPETTDNDPADPAETPQTPPTVATLIVDRPLRSGQQAYARGGDLVVLAAVSSGAEVIADGSIHVYAPLRGRALAGASGATDARIFTTRFEAELVSIAGVYRTFESGVPAELAGKPVQISLSEGADDESSRLLIVPLKTD